MKGASVRRNRGMSKALVSYMHELVHIITTVKMDIVSSYLEMGWRYTVCYTEMIDSASLYDDNNNNENALGYDRIVAKRLEDILAKCICAECYCEVCDRFYSKDRIKREMLTV